MIFARHLSRLLIPTCSLLLLWGTACTKSGKKGSGSPGGAGETAEESEYAGDADGTPGEGEPAAKVRIKPTDKQATEEFRNIFFSLGRDEFSGEDLQKLVYLPTDAMLDLKLRGSSPAEALANYTSDFGQFLPSQFYDQGRAVPYDSAPGVEKIFEKNGPITIIVVPGIFSEFIETYSFFDLIENSSSSLSKQFADAYESTTDESLKTDASFDFESLALQEKPLDAMLRTASIDDAEGRPLLNVLTLTSPMFSGESLGDIEDNAEVYIRRISKYFQLVGEQKNVYLMGYSRGATVGLQMVVDIEKRKDSLPWAKNVKGFISLGGVLYGAGLADAAFKEKDPLQALLGRIQALTDSLELVDDDASIASSLVVATKNSGRWVAAAAEVAAMMLKLPLDEGLGMEKISSDLPQLDANLNMLRKIAFENFDLSDPSFDNYFDNIRKFKFIIGKAIAGIKSLRTDTRIEWWQKNTIPSHLKYFAIAGTMGDHSNPQRGVWPLTGNATAFNSRAVDYLALRFNYYDSFRVTKVQVSDSQVSLDRTRFIPELHTMLNPAQGPFESYYMGVLGVDHWGMAFPFATQTRNREQSPFPRTLLLKSIGAFVARYQE